ncbi:MAG: type II toxin-antitoxin system ParD family antitoxin [Alphaproteobacteria bacterium]
MSTIAVDLPPELADFLRRQVATGLYDNEADVIRDALRRLWAEDWTDDDARAEALHAALREGLADIEAGKVYECSVDEIIAEARAAPAARK